MSTATEGGGRAGAAWREAAAAVVAFLGVLDSVYLTAEHLSGRSVRCVVVSGCDAVLSSGYATLFGSVPLAAAGAAGYFLAFSLAVLAAYGYKSLRGPLAALVALMFAFTLWLLYVQAFVLRAFCTYCLLSAALTTTLFVLVVLIPLFQRRRPV